MAKWIFGRKQWIVSMGFLGIFHNVLGENTARYTESQATAGEAIYQQRCAACHGEVMQGGEFGPGLLSRAFISHWASRPLGSLLVRIRSTMPPGGGGTLPDTDYVAIVAYILESYGVKAGSIALPVDQESLNTIVMPGTDALEPSVRGGGLGLVPEIALPAWPTRASPADRITYVSEGLLANPPAGSWLTWRRTRDAAGFSPLRQISKNNVARLHVAWTLTLPPGPSETTPLAHDGVIFVQSYGDHVQALDAATGDELWHYFRELPHSAYATVHRNMALHDANLYFVTSDAHVIALSARTGRFVWDAAIGDSSRNIFAATGGPIIVGGVLMVGVNAATSPGGGYIIGLDTATGHVLWKFNTIAPPDDVNGNTWNGLPLESRTGGSVWTAGSYDVRTGLAFFGPAPTYDTKLLRSRVNKPGVSNDALYTNATVALDPQTGRLAWYYQHLPNDQWDLDWAFERQIVDLRLNGRSRRLVITAGKEAIYDALDARTGRYEFSLDLGLQNLVTAIDSKTGTKHVDPTLVPSDNNTVTVCPCVAGAKSWLPGSYDSGRHLLFVPLVESCMDISATRRWGIGNIKLRPPFHGDGKYGRLQAIDLQARRTLWTVRQRAPQTTGVLATEGGVVFAGALDRWFRAYAADNGAPLWGARLTDVPNAAPITYAVNGIQYVAVVVGGGYGQTETFRPLVPEIREPPSQGAAIWVFALSQ